MRKRREITIDKEIYEWLAKLCGKFDPPLSEERFAEALIVAGLWQIAIVEGIASGIDPATFIQEEVLSE